MSLLDSPLTSTREYWRRLFRLPEEVCLDPRPCFEALAEREDGKELADSLALAIARHVTAARGNLAEYMIDLAVRQQKLRPDLVAAVRGARAET